MLRSSHLTFKDTLRACYFGYITQAIVNNIAPLLFVIFQDAFTISYEMLGRLVLINFGTQIASDIVSMRIADRVGYRIMAVTAHLLSALGLILLGVLPHVMADPYMGLVIAVVIYAIGGGIIEVLISPIVESLPGEQKASAMSLLHSFYCWGQLTIVIVTTLLLYFMGTGIWYFLPALWALVPLFREKERALRMVALKVKRRHQTSRHDLGIAHLTLHIVTMMMRLQQIVTQTVDKYNRGIHEGLLEWLPVSRPTTLPDLHGLFNWLIQPYSR